MNLRHEYNNPNAIKQINQNCSKYTNWTWWIENLKMVLGLTLWNCVHALWCSLLIFPQSSSAFVENNPSMSGCGLLFPEDIKNWIAFLIKKMWIVAPQRHKKMWTISLIQKRGLLLIEDTKKVDWFSNPEVFLCSILLAL